MASAVPIVEEVRHVTSCNYTTFDSHAWMLFAAPTPICFKILKDEKLMQQLWNHWRPVKRDVREEGNICPVIRGFRWNPAGVFR
jgi:hypothetical protein